MGVERQKWQEMVFMYQKVLHPDFFDPICKQWDKVYNEMKEEAYRDAKISKEAREIEQYMIRLQDNLKRNGHMADVRRFYLKNFFKHLLKMFSIDGQE